MREKNENARGMDDIIAAKRPLVYISMCVESIINLKVEFFQWKLKKIILIESMEWRARKNLECVSCALTE